MVVFVYAVFIFLILRFCVTLFNFLSNPKLGYYGKHFTDKVSVIILAPNTREGVGKITQSIEGQEYSNVEVIVQQDENITELLGRATGAYFLLITSGTTLHHGLLNNLIFRVKVFNLAVVSLNPTYNAHGFLAQCIYPLSDFLLLNLFPLRLIRLSHTRAFASAGSNDCLFFDADHYKQLNWNQTPLHSLPSAVEIVKLVKQHRFKAEVLLANKFLRYDAYDIDTKNFAQHLLLNFSNSAVAALFYVIPVVIGLPVIWLNFGSAILLLPVVLIFMSRLMIAFLTQQNPVRHVFLHPLQMLTLLVLTLDAVVRQLLGVIKPKK